MEYNIDEITVILDDRLKSKAKEMAGYYDEESRKCGILKTVENGYNLFFIGFLGELAMQKYLGLPYKIKRYIDFGHDFDLNGKKVEVKTSKLKSPLKELKEGYKVFVATNERIKNSDIISFVRVSPSFVYAYLLGWVESDRLNEFPVVKYGNMPTPAHTIFLKYLKPVYLLKSDLLKSDCLLDRWM